MNSFPPNNPQVSIIVPNYNHAPYLEKRIDSILSQTFQDFELILLDDGSNDTSVKIINNYKNHDKVSHILLNKQNSGSPFGLWQYGIEKAKGKYIWIAESDDWAEDSFLEKLIKSFEDPAVVVSHCRSYDANSSGEVIGVNTWWSSFNVNLWDSDFNTDGLFLLNSYGQYKCPVINVSSALFRKSILDSVEIPCHYRYCGDWFFWAQMFQKGKIAFHSTPLNYFRNHNNSATGKFNSDNLERIKENIIVVNNICSQLNKRFRYHENFSWLIDLMVDSSLVNRNYVKKKYLFLKIPYSFRLVYYNRLLGLLLVKLIKNKGK